MKLENIENYKIINAEITSVDLDMSDHGALTLRMALKGSGWGAVYGGYVLAHGYLDADDDEFDGTAKGIESIARIMDVVGVSKFNDMKGKYVRVVDPGLGKPFHIIGNIIKNKWFNIDEFFKEENV